jgi:hypothetical protein
MLLMKLETQVAPCISNQVEPIRNIVASSGMGVRHRAVDHLSISSRYDGQCQLKMDGAVFWMAFHHARLNYHVIQGVTLASMSTTSDRPLLEALLYEG